MADVREIAAEEELEACVEIEADTWGREVLHRVDVDHLRRTIASGGILLGAFEDGRLVGFVFSYRIEVDGGGIQHSHLLAVLPAHRGRGLGPRLKLAQREAARERGDSLVVWTFDPLEAVNAGLNLGRLGATARRYLVDFYGDTGSPLHQGLPTDRLLAEWSVEPSGERPCRKPDRTPVEGRELWTISTRWREDHLLEPLDVRLGLDAARLFLPIPRRIQEVKRRDPELAGRWSFVVRRACLHYLDGGYQARGFLAAGQGSQPATPGYVLEKTRGEESLADRLDMSRVPFFPRSTAPAAR